jgi:hypothetical protein
MGAMDNKFPPARLDCMRGCATKQLSSNYNWNPLGVIAIFVSITALVLVVFYTLFIMTNDAYGQSDSNSDFYLEGYVDSSNVSNSYNAIGLNTSGLNITKLEFRGDALKSICPSGQCRIDYNMSMSPSDRQTAYLSDYFSVPKLDDTTIDYNLHFKVKDDTINATVGPIKKHYLEEHYVNQFACTVKDVIEDNRQEIYYCDGHPSVTRQFDSKSWYFDTIGKYDAKTHIYTEIGNNTN